MKDESHVEAKGLHLLNKIHLDQSNDIPDDEDSQARPRTPNQNP